MLRPNANTDDVSHDPSPPGQGIDDFQLPGRLDWSGSFEHGIQSLVRIHLEELRNARWKFAPLLHSLECHYSITGITGNVGGSVAHNLLAIVYCGRSISTRS
jgi:hypothetical protein